MLFKAGAWLIVGYFDLLMIIIFRSNVKPHIAMIPDGTAFSYASESAAISGLKKAVAEGRVEILD